MTCNVMAGAKLFCSGLKTIGWNRQAIPPLSAGSADDLNAITQALGAAASLENNAAAPRCSCQKPKGCIPVSRLMLAANPLQRFNEEQRSTRLESIDVHHSVNRTNSSFQGCCGPPPAMGGKGVAAASHDNILSLACVLLI
ncbi:MAG: hypothetical protein ACP5M0_02050 [Desulfomonilaceae bacterium]